MTRIQKPPRRNVVNRLGSVLLVVLVLVVMLSLGAYTFSERMVSEVEGVDNHGRLVQARLLSASGVESVAALLDDRQSFNPTDLYDNPQLFHQILVQTDESETGSGRFSVIAPVPQGATNSSVRFGLMDESAKLNLNDLIELEFDQTLARQRLLALPAMTNAIADAILDWLDDDDGPRLQGAENDYYLSLESPYRARNGPLHSLRELLRVRGVTPWLLLGEDTNCNGRLDPNENDGNLTPPFDNADGFLQEGWVTFLTVNSRERNCRSDGQPRINLNLNSLTELYDELEIHLGKNAARFIAAYRISGPYNADLNTDSKFSSNNSPTTGSQSFAAKLRRQSGNVVRDGLDLASEGRFSIYSIYDLIGVRVRANVDGKLTTLDSPWKTDTAEMQAYLPQLTELLTTTDDEFILGRINVSQAREEVLLGLPGVTRPLANAIVHMQKKLSQHHPLSPTGTLRTTTGWLLTQGLVDLEQIRLIDPFITAQGDVHGVQVLGYFDNGGPVVRTEAVIDATRTPSKILFLRDLTGLGRVDDDQFSNPPGLSL